MGSAPLLGVEAAFVRAGVLGSGDRSPVPASGRSTGDPDEGVSSGVMVNYGRATGEIWCLLAFGVRFHSNSAIIIP